MGPRTTKRWIGLTAASVVLAFLLGCGGFLAFRFPFRRDVLLNQLPTQAGTKVEIGQFTDDWIRPAFYAQKVRLSDRAGNVITMDRIAVRGSYSGFMGKPVRLKQIDISGLRILLSRRGGAAKPFGISGSIGSNPALRVDEIRLDNAVLAVPRDAPGLPPLEFVFHTAIIQDLGRKGSLRFQVAARNPTPSGEVHLKGEASPFGVAALRELPIEGHFTFERADLSVPRSISGLLSASGNCRGTLGHLQCAGTADVPHFEVYGSKHPVHIASRFEAAVDTLTGDAELSSVLAHFNRTTVSAKGNVSGHPDPKGKTLTLDMAVRDGRLEDLLSLFTSAPMAGMRAAIDMHGRFVIPPGPADFLTKLKVDGEFSLQRAFFTNPRSQTPLDRLSASAQGQPKSEQRENPGTVPGNVRAGVTSKNGIASLQNVVFSFPGIQGHLAGTFALHDKQVHLNGVLETQGKLSDTSSGLKALLLKVIGPLWPKTGSVKSIPFSVSGRGSHTSFRLRLHEK